MEALNHIYTDLKDSGSLTSVRNLYNSAKNQGLTVKYKDVEDFLSSKDSHTLHALSRVKFARSKVYAKKPLHIFQADVVFMTDFKKENNGNSYILVVIDIFSKRAYFEAMKTKSTESILKALKEIFRRSDIPEKIHTDLGGEFTSKKMQKFLKQKNIQHYVTYSSYKAQIAERLIRTLKSMLYKYFTEYNTHRWVDVLSSCEFRYNNSFHSSILMKPIEVNETNINKVWMNLYGLPLQNRTSQKFKVDDNVRISA